MSILDTRTTVGEFVKERPSRARVFERLGIDYCCGGKKPLEVVCQAHGLDPSVVLRELSDHDARTVEAKETDWASASLTELTNHIVSAHHDYLRRELPRLEFLVNKVADVHGHLHPELRDIRAIFAKLKPDLEEHTAKEESILFPWIKQLEAGSGSSPISSASVGQPISMMEADHDEAGEALSKFRELTRGYQPPEDACNSFRAMLDGLADLEADMHQHVHKENNILFPAALALESKSSQKQAN